MALECEGVSNPAIDVKVPQLSWKLNDSRQGAAQTGYQILVASSPEKLAVEKGDLWDSGKVDSNQSVLVTYKGAPLSSRKRVFWKVRYWDQNGRGSPFSEVGVWRMGLLSGDDWQAEWIAAPVMEESTSEQLDLFLEVACSSVATKRLFAGRKPTVCFRREFVVSGEVQDAVVRVCGLGAFDLYVNGKKVGDAVLDPIQSDYDKLAYYPTHDVTSLLRTGANVIGVEVADGWYGQSVVWGESFGYGHPRALLELEYTDTDGQRSFVGTDPEWKVRYGPTRRSNIYAGEMYDARLELSGWTTAGYDESGWESAIGTNPGSPRLAAQMVPSIRPVRSIHPIAKWSPSPGVWVFDFGQNFAGAVKLRIPGYERGRAITLQMGECLNSDRTVNFKVMGATGVLQTQTYVCKGGGQEEWQPSFSYFGFRYAQVTGLPCEPELSLLEGIQLRTDVERIGYFRCSYDLFNDIHRLAVWTLESNLHGVIEDCPHREKCGWLGDAHVSLDTWLMNFRMDVFNRKFIEDIRHTYHENGLLGEIAGGKRKYGPPAMLDWMVATLIIPWNHYLYSGDQGALMRHYSFMKRFAEAVHPLVVRRYETGNLNLIRQDRFFFGDWGDVAPDGKRQIGEFALFPAETPAMLTGTQTIIYGLRCLADTADALRKEDDQKRYDGMADELVMIVNEQYFDETLATYGSQAANAWAHFLKMVPDESKALFRARFGEEIESVDQMLMTVGQVGLGRLFQELTDAGYGELVLSLSERDAGHGFKRMLARGATTLWEFQGRGNPIPAGSLNHPAFSGYDAWFYQYLGGVRPLADFPGFKKTRLKPYFAPWINWVEVVYESPYGAIRSGWKRLSDGTVEWSVTVPPNTTAIAEAPQGMNFSPSGGVRQEVVAGTYKFCLVETPNGRGANKELK